MTNAAAATEDRLCEALSEPCAPLTEAERSDLLEQHRRHREHLDAVYEKLRLDAQALEHSPILADPTGPTFEQVVVKALDDYRSGLALMDHLGASRLLDPATTGMLLAIRRGLIEDTSDIRGDGMPCGTKALGIGRQINIC